MDTMPNVLSYPHPRCCPIQEEIQSIKTEVNRLDECISDLQGRIKRLQAQLAPLQRKRDNYASYTSPLRNLPVDILAEILQICLNNGVKREILASTCGTIRDAFVGIPGFWNKIRIWGRYRLKEYSYFWSEMDLISSKRHIICWTVEQLDICTNSHWSDPSRPLYR
jgi:hypothetical protein